MNFINITVKENPIDLFWESTQFAPTSEIFPCWLCADPILNDYVDKLGDFTVTSDHSNIDFGPIQPMVRDLLTGKMVLMWETFPEKDRGQFIEIFTKCVKQYCPSLDHFKRQKVCNNSTAAIMNQIRGHHLQIHSMGGPSFKEWLRFSLGLRPLGFIL